MGDVVDGEPPILASGKRNVAAKKPKKKRAVGRGEASGHESDSSGEDLFGDSMERDYLAHPTLDRYDPEDIDDQSDYSPMSIRQRQEVEKLMDRRDRRIGDPAARRALLYGIGQVLFRKFLLTQLQITHGTVLALDSIKNQVRKTVGSRGDSKRRFSVLYLNRENVLTEIKTN